MSAILLSAGPVSTSEAMKYTSRRLHDLKAMRFSEAATELQNINLGTLVSISQTKGRVNKVFVKKSPEEAEQVLGANPHLCSVDNYTARYNKPPSKAIGLQLKAKLVAMKIVPKKIFT